MTTYNNNIPWPITFSIWDIRNCRARKAKTNCFITHCLGLPEEANGAIMEVLTRYLLRVNVKSRYLLLSIAPWIIIINPPPWLLPQNFRQSVYLLPAWPSLERFALVTENWYKRDPKFSNLFRVVSWNCSDVWGHCVVYECRLKIKSFDAWAEPQQLYRSDGLRHDVVVPIPAPVRVGVIDEPFHRNIIAVVTNTAVLRRIWERYLNFPWGSDLF